MNEQNDFQPSEKMLNQILQMPCPSCGSELSYSAEKQAINCKHCGYTQDYDRANDLIRERSLADAARSVKRFTPEAIQKHVVECEACRSQIMVEDNEVAVRCNFCGSEKVNKAAFTKNLIQPQGIIPFDIPKRDAIEKFKKWIAEGWFRPNALKRLAQLGDIHGIYLPFWTFDADSYNEWAGEAGFYYYVEVERDGKTEREQRTRWEWRDGEFSKGFDDILILAAEGAAEKVVEGIYPYSLQKAVNYNPTLMVGWEAQIYTVEVDKGYNKAADRMRAEIRSEASRRLGGDTQRGLQVHSDIYNQTFKHLILPVWLCTYMYNGKAYQFAVNGQTGKISGQKPVSWVKVFFFVLFLVAVVGAIIYFTEQNQ